MERISVRMRPKRNRKEKEGSTMKPHFVLRQILIAALIIALFSVGILVVSFMMKDAKPDILSAYAFEGGTAVVYTSDGRSTGANCPVYALGDKKYLALFDPFCELMHDGLRKSVIITRNGDACETVSSGKKETRPLEMLPTDGMEYEFFGGGISLYPFDKGWISTVFLMNQAGGPVHESVRFGNAEMSAKEYREAFSDAPSLVWDETNEVYLDEWGQAYETMSTYESEVRVLYSADEKDAYVSFYLTDQQYESLMKDRIFELCDADGGRMSALFWIKE